MSSHNLIVLSDVHLGSDLVHCVRPDAKTSATSDERDRELSRLLDFYREHPRGGLPWRLVIAGDLVDFVGMSVAAPSRRTFASLTQEDEVLGLGSAEEQAAYKLRCVAERHEPVFRSLARFIQAGNRLVVVRGNHDVDFHWPEVQAAFFGALAAHASIDRASVEFSPWFYYERGRVYVEHGHQYDRYCSHETLLNPVSPEDPRRSWSSLSDVLLRHVVRPTRGLSESGHDRAGALDYVRFGLSLGIGGMFSLATRFVRAVVTLLSIWRQHMSDGAARIRREHERRMSELAALLNLKLDSLRQLSKLQRPPVTTDLRRLVQTVMLDRVLLGLLGAVAILAAFVVAHRWHQAVGMSAAVTLGIWGTGYGLKRARRDIEPSRELREGAFRVASLFPAAFVVMGHTHLPEVTPHEGATYVNLGAWSADEDGQALAGHPGKPPTKTHWVLLEENGVSEAGLYVWDPQRGPRRFGETPDPARGPERADPG